MASEHPFQDIEFELEGDEAEAEVDGEAPPAMPMEAYGSMAFKFGSADPPAEVNPANIPTDAEIYGDGYIE